MKKSRLKPRILLIEDNAERITTFRDWLARTEFIAIEASSGGRAMGILRKGMTEGIVGLCLDHDLNDQPVTDVDPLLSGSHLIRAIATSLPRSVPILVHSMNYDKAHGMCKQLATLGYSVKRIPMAVLNDERFSAWLQDVRESFEE